MGKEKKKEKVSSLEKKFVVYMHMKGVCRSTLLSIILRSDQIRSESMRCP